ncbi:hypothetical protein DCS_08075 [Drechmeria coniospora]|uniref:Uncharacterized protein n=1 Tax=Drechmeria coniospora TaxID=98403 RepID=A0A151GG88_DRECN|nr:hypothetical protein DCS_08075 [Drechmeria coniospora]KYK56109.1 hypothetical protein DCS_08075 [Drechmeria coniospora]
MSTEGVGVPAARQRRESRRPEREEVEGGRRRPKGTTRRGAQEEEEGEGSAQRRHTTAPPDGVARAPGSAVAWYGLGRTGDGKHHGDENSNWNSKRPSGGLIHGSLGVRAGPLLLLRRGGSPRVVGVVEPGSPSPSLSSAQPCPFPLAVIVGGWPSMARRASWRHELASRSMLSAARRQRCTFTDGQEGEPRTRAVGSRRRQMAAAAAAAAGAESWATPLRAGPRGLGVACRRAGARASGMPPSRPRHENVCCVGGTRRAGFERGGGAVKSHAQ